MGLGDDIYTTDARGHRVLIGLSVAETDEFLRLEASIAERDTFVSMTAREWCSPAERRWLALYEKHLAALRLRRGGPPSR